MWSALCMMSYTSFQIMKKQTLKPKLFSPWNSRKLDFIFVDLRIMSNLCPQGYRLQPGCGLEHHNLRNHRQFRRSHIIFGVRVLKINKCIFFSFSFTVYHLHYFQSFSNQLPVLHIWGFVSVKTKVKKGLSNLHLFFNIPWVWA